MNDNPTKHPVTFAEIACWLNRNCKNCRYSKPYLDKTETLKLCVVPKEAVQNCIHNTPASKQFIGIVFYPKTHLDTQIITRLPYKCYSRVDSRGRPRKHR